MVKLTVQLLVWNGEKYLPHLFESLRKQTSKDWQIFILDNGSADNSVSVIKKELANFSIPNFFEEGESNIGFSPGHNYIYEQTDTEYVLMLNQDLYLEPNCIERLISFMDKNSEVASVSPRLMKWNINSLDHFFSEYVDSLGLKVFKNRRAVDWYNGQKYENFLNTNKDKKEIEVFGVSGTLPMFRRSNINSILYDNKYIFDPDYSSYKEDVDLAYRLRSAGFKSYVVLDTCAYHDRTSDIEITVIDNKKKQPEHVKYYSYRNHLMTIYKNEYLLNFILDFFWILWYEVGKFIWFLLFDRKVLKGLGDIWKFRKNLKSRRRQIIKQRKIGWYKIRTWF
ncbi:MAG: hypothetical protein A2725_00230 [Candidatus Magasanikbacteria bacterium RIFCSPHIGHO2_01_FULL_33_34]|uniref:Glycosyltransferase 2-like domain-containing protein n=1 Tax=Candidatus Magasanikbacteria bacterium RIFCSPHIGHO2_01_FULL_33_34 TaxID=1798671 RepID=A0A1F6LL95_9BACT|nr:MAG: hypothetical protein A2725_00230 [Candidatus Magasanikbacteria bacterium RIFCSPHIGHO2_01_FULL_33_34]OGH65788.1 MAG: hypothetical protein A3B83_02900 [Candidatus Magasanikbacteria bacterium RIFCSPHIGHO2_02_FULL_33_17]OGH75153.1 MAG: hypothetical protein A3A89_03495 [Candidatus Magasanikbacteria bacterium RIFCSPLOWO2_01_FULL_33_34]OGH81541.1 MAG: hypothetical protein A3F93_00555 [Candidatus Magasanikbacteria bacterium RIFCSPLOWO2_12_FULL_34_7]